MPLVTVPDRPSGAPMASTESPTASALDRPRVAAFSPLMVTLTTARSVLGSRPTMVAFTASASVPPLGTTCRLPADGSAA